jgi:hypothetical protein
MCKDQLHHGLQNVDDVTVAQPSQIVLNIRIFSTYRQSPCTVKAAQ